jgi:hypothetical protein
MRFWRRSQSSRPQAQALDAVAASGRTAVSGRDSTEERTALPYRGVINALIRARIPYLPVHADHIERDVGRLSALILPNVGALSDAQCARVRAFVERGGGLIATGESSRYDEWGDPRPDFALADLFGAHATATHHGSLGPADPSWEAWATHTYVRLTPELRARVYGPQVGTEPQVSGGRHPVLAGFDDTDILPFAGRIEVVQVEKTAQVPVTFVPPFPIYPPETAWMRHPTSSVPALILNEPFVASRVAYLPADIDRCFGRDNLPDHADLLANVVRWVAQESIPLTVEGPGLIDCHLYRQEDRLILHVVSLTSAGTWRAPIHELIPVGPLTIRVKRPERVSGRTVRLLVAEKDIRGATEDGWVCFDVPLVTDHEVAVIS